MVDKAALISGVTGQDEAYLAELLLGKGYLVHGIRRRSSSFNTAKVTEQGIQADTGRVLVEVDPRYFRPTEVERLLGDPSKAHQKLGWKHRVTFDQLVCEMVDEDLKAIRIEHKLRVHRD